MKVDSLGTLNTLGLAKLKSARYVFASSSEVYGDPLVHPQREDYWGNVSPVGVRSVYSEAKRFSEALCMAYYREHGVDVRILRIFNTYGERMRIGDGRVVPTFLDKALKGEPIPVHGGGTQTRSFCYIEDMVEGIFRASIKDGIEGEVINLGSPEEISILDLARLVVELTNSNSSIQILEAREDDPKRRCPDITKAKNLLGWEPKTTLRDGLKKTIEWLKSYSRR
jgi:Nucleoside-diphosphate-sugar epimerases